MPDGLTTKSKPRGPSKWLAGSGLLTGIVSFIGASCCVLPIILINLGVSSALVSKLAVFARYQEWFQGSTIGLLIVAALLAFRAGRPRKSALILLILGSAFALAAYVFPAYELEILEWLKTS